MCFCHILAPSPAHKTVLIWYLRPSPLMSHRVPLLSQPTCGPQWSSLIPSSCPGLSSSSSVLGPVLFLVFINDLSDSLEKPLFLFADDPTLCRTICHPSDREPQLLRSLLIWVKSQTGPTRGTCLSILTNLTLSLCLSKRTI